MVSTCHNTRFTSFHVPSSRTPRGSAWFYVYAACYEHGSALHFFYLFFLHFIHHNDTRSLGRFFEKRQPLHTAAGRCFFYSFLFCIITGHCCSLLFWGIVLDLAGTWGGVLLLFRLTWPWSQEGLPPPSLGGQVPTTPGGALVFCIRRCLDGARRLETYPSIQAAFQGIGFWSVFLFWDGSLVLPMSYTSGRGSARRVLSSFFESQIVTIFGT